MARVKKPAPITITAQDIEDARGWHAVIKANVDRFYSDSITHAEFSANQRQTWAIIETKSHSVREALSDLMLDNLRAHRAA